MKLEGNCRSLFACCSAARSHEQERRASQVAVTAIEQLFALRFANGLIQARMIAAKNTLSFLTNFEKFLPNVIHSASHYLCIEVARCNAAADDMQGAQ